MNRYLITFLLMIISNYVYSQTNIISTYGKSNIGWNFRFGFEHVFNEKISVGLGTRIIHKTGKNNFTFQAYKDKFYPIKTIEYFGLYSTFSYYFLKRKEYFLQPSIGYDFSFSRAHIKWNRFFQKNDNNGNPINLYEKKEIIFNPLNAFEHHFFISLDIKMLNNLKLTQSIGLGIVHYSGYYNNQSNIIVGEPYEFSWFFFNIGLKYDFSDLIKKHLTNAKKQ